MRDHTAAITVLARLTQWLAMAAIGIGLVFWLQSTAIELFSGAENVNQWFDWGPYRLRLNGAPEDPWSLFVAHHPRLGWTKITATSAIGGIGLLRLIQLMRIYRAGSMFDQRASGYLAGFASCMFLSELVDILGLPLITSFLHWRDSREPLLFAFTTDQLYALFLATLFLLVSRVIAAAHVVADDNERII